MGDENERNSNRSEEVSTFGAFVDRENTIVTRSPGEIIGITGGGFDATTDTMPGQQATAPARLSSKAAHGLHVDALDAFKTAL